MLKLRWPLRLYVAGVIAAALLALATGLVGVTPPTEPQLIVFALLLVLASAGQLRPLHLSQKMKVSVEDTATFAAALTLGPTLAMLVAGLSAAATWPFSAARSWYNRAFNASVATLATGVGATVYALLAGPDRSVVPNVLPLALSGVTMYLLHSALVDIVVGLQLRRHPFANWRQLHGRELAPVGGLYAVGALAAFASELSPLALLLFAMPVAVVFATLQDRARLHQRSREALMMLADLVDQRDPYTHGHQRRTAEVAERLARHMRLVPSQIELVRDAARVHDIGKVGTDDHLLLKPGPLDPEEREDMRQHAEHGANLLGLLPDFWEARALVLAHHERFDGSGYPRGLRGNELPLEVGLVAVADAYDAMTSDRPYRKPMPWNEVRAQLLAGRGKQWDPRVIDAFIEMMEQDRPLRGTAPERSAAASEPRQLTA